MALDEVTTHELEGLDGLRGFYTFVPLNGRDGSPLTGPDGEGFKQLLEQSTRTLASTATKSGARLGTPPTPSVAPVTRPVTKTATGLFKFRLPPK